VPSITPVSVTRPLAMDMAQIPCAMRWPNGVSKDESMPTTWERRNSKDQGFICPIVWPVNIRRGLRRYFAGEYQTADV